MNTLTIKDQKLNGETANEIQLEFDKRNINLKELIEARVREEVKKYSHSSNLPYQGLVTPKEIETTLNKEKKLKRIDIEKQVYVALDGFQKNRFFVLINDQQIDDLDFYINIEEVEYVSFLRLTPLVGG